MKLWGIGSARARVPGPDEIHHVIALIDYRNVVLDPKASTVFLKNPGMGLDLGSIAKGYAADEVARIFQAHGTRIGYVEITGGSVTTAGTYERFFEQGGKRCFHILDARTGYPAWNGLAAVAIVAGDSTTADEYDTLVFTLGLEHGRSFVESLKGKIEAVFITEKREVYVTPGLRSRFTLTDARFTELR